MRHRCLRGSVWVLLAVGLILGTFGCGGSGPSFPARDVTIVVPFGAGGATDMVFRTLAETAKPHLGVEVLIKNVAGGGGAVGLAEVATAKPDGYTVGYGGNVNLVCVPQFASVPYRGTDSFEFVLQTHETPMLITVPNDSPYKTLKDLLSAAKEKPGSITYSTPGEGTVWHINMLLLEKETGVKMTAVPFTSAAESATAVLGRHVNVAAIEPQAVVQYLTEGRLRALAVMTENRLPALQDVPTLREQGVDIVGWAWGALVVPKGTPQPAIVKLHDAFKIGMDAATFKDVMAKAGYVIHYADGKAASDRWTSEYARTEALVREVFGDKKK